MGGCTLFCILILFECRERKLKYQDLLCSIQKYSSMRWGVKLFSFLHQMFVNITEKTLKICFEKKNNNKKIAFTPVSFFEINLLNRLCYVMHTNALYISFFIQKLNFSRRFMILFCFRVLMVYTQVAMGVYNVENAYYSTLHFT